MQRPTGPASEQAKQAWGGLPLIGVGNWRGAKCAIWAFISADDRSVVREWDAGTAEPFLVEIPRRPTTPRTSRGEYARQLLPVRMITSHRRPPSQPFRAISDGLSTHGRSFCLQSA